MQVIDFVVAPISDKINNSIHEVESKVGEYCDLIETVNEKHNLSAPFDLYEYEIIEGVKLVDYLYNEEHYISHDARSLLLETIMEIGSRDENLSEILDVLNNDTNDILSGMLGVGENIFLKNDDLFVSNVSDMNKLYRYYLLKSDSLTKFESLMEDSFPNLIFHERTKFTIQAFRDIEKHKVELCRHLSILNDHAKDLYIEDPQKFYDAIQSKHNIYISGRGSNEGLEKFKCEFKDRFGKLVVVRCNPHTKLYAKHSDFRIYFNFGNNDISRDKILVGHVGSHWR